MKQEIEIDCPEGYEPVAYRAPQIGDYYMRADAVIVTKCNFVFPPSKARLIVKKIIPERRVFERVGSGIGQPKQGYFYTDASITAERSLYFCRRDDENFSGDYELWKEIKE